MLLVEFTIEPFIEARPGAHVTAAVEAAEALGATIDFGPFGSSCTVPQELVGPVSSAVIEAAMANGATHVSLHVERLAGA